MTNTPTAPTPATTPNWLTTWISWLKAHEKLLLVAVGAFVLFHLYDKGLAAWQTHDQLISSKAAQQVVVDHTANDQVQAQLTQLITTVGQQQITLDKLMLQRAMQTTQQKKADSQMSPSQLATRFQGLLKVAPADVTSLEPSGNLVFTPVASQAGIDSLEDLQQCKLDVIDLKTELGGQESLVSKQTNLLNGTQKELTDEKASHAADIKLLNTKVKRAWIKGFKWGAIIGGVGVEAIRIFIIHKP